ncbi:MAG: PilN domain-containing protein [Candidatus Omnitrophica bacterium]|nr:PilN domain-containing protein [Candidatus Omnitrophota bacterium]MCF7877407.1 PilN domain-containing protein [Candidatus Omnitrophota bacterium]MCF7878624.1 PilN domain-containing protein [Candidatus Omnitrophota bacterium]MCF7892642.1 PilN domain-containing protein [Candidatus Omnitrophota bacterium]
MKKIAINLNPKKPDTFNQGLEKILDYTPLLAFLVIFFALIAGSVGAFSLVKAKKYNGYQNIWKKWEPKNNKLTKIKANLSGLKKESRKVEKAITPAYTGVNLLNSFFSALPKNIWLKNLHFTQKMINVEGYIVEWDKDSLASLENFIESLKANENFLQEFKRIDIKDTKKTDFNGVEVTQFIIECKKLK